jgi:NAD(P)H-dependent FMN reductase
MPDARLPLRQIVIGSTRPGRVGKPVAEWVAQEARSHGGFEIEVVDLAEVNLPLFNEPRHPRFGDYEHEHTKNWSSTISRADALVFVIPEYNHSFSAAVKNALDYLHKEWQYKPVGLVSYGGVAAGTRAVQSLKPVLTALKAVPLAESVNIPFVAQFIKDGHFTPNTELEASVKTLLDELNRWTDALSGLAAAS